MSDYIDYIKGGDILIAPTVHFKHRYILKCSLCDEYYGEFEEFFSHYLSHNDVKFSEEASYPLYEKVDKVEVGDGDDEGEVAVNKDGQTKYDYVEGEQEDDALMNTEEIFIKEENTLPDTNSCYRPIEVVQTDGSNAQNTCNPVEMTYEDVELDTEATGSKYCNLAKCVRNFMKSKTNAITLIEAYKCQPLLWNINYLPHRRAKERQKCLQQIVDVLKKELNLNLTCNEVSGILIFMRQKYKEKLRSVEFGDTKSGKDKTLGYLKNLDFLKPFMENNSIAVLSEDRPHMAPEQITQILGIYKQYPHLWDSNLIENCCKNKRTEAIDQMLNTANSEMNLELNQNLLENYLYSIHAYFSKEKRRDMGATKVTENRPEYYEHMTFLYDHVAPFKCPTCLRDFRNPLYFKEHLIEHDASVRLKCSQCNKEYKSATLYIEHAKRHMNDMGKECKECGKQFLKTRALTHHMRIHTGDKPYVCDVCGVSFRHIQTFTAHKRTHSKDYMHHCPICSKGFYTKSTMNVHVATHKSERNYVCKTCSKAFKTKINLTHHEWTHEDGCHPCDLCGKTYKNKYSLYQHMKTHRKKIEII